MATRVASETMQLEPSYPTSRQRRTDHESQNGPLCKKPLMLTIWILCMAASGFACGVRDLPWWYQLLTAVMPFSSIILLWLTHLIDPGIIPPAQEKDAVMELLLDNNLDGVPQRELYSRDPATHVWRKSVDYKGVKDYDRLCTTCNIWRPPRGHHCRSCGHCMAHFDHHCDVVGNCIAGNNHRWFAMFLMTAQVGCGLLLGGAIWRMQLIQVPSKDTWGNPEAYFLIILAVFYAYHLLMLIFGNMHCVFVMFDITTKDCTKTELATNLPCLPGTRNPLQLASHWKVMCCAPIKPRSYSTCPSPNRV